MGVLCQQFESDYSGSDHNDATCLRERYRLPEQHGPQDRSPEYPKSRPHSVGSPSGSFLKASARKTALAIYPIPVMTLGMIFVNPSDIFMNTAQVTSRIPATSRNNHSII